MLKKIESDLEGWNKLLCEDVPNSEEDEELDRIDESIMHEEFTI